MALLRKPWKTFVPMVSQTRSVYWRCRIGGRDVVGHGKNGIYGYADDPSFPFPAIRFLDNTPYINALREKERGDWKLLSCEEKKCLYRASYCQTFAEFLAPTGVWKFVLGIVCFALSFPFWMCMFCRNYVWEKELPKSFSLESRQHQLRRMLDLRVNPIDGISSQWDYDADDWKVAIVLALIGMVVCTPVPSAWSGIGHGYGSPLLLPSAVSVSSSVVNHGIPIVKVAPVVKIIPHVIPVVKAIPYAPITWPGLGYGYGHGWGYH